MVFYRNDILGAHFDQGKRIPLNPQSICAHGDNADAVAAAQLIRDGLLVNGKGQVIGQRNFAYNPPM